MRRVRGGGGSKLVHVNLNHNGKDDAGMLMRDSGSWMCLYSVWSALRVLYWEKEDFGGQKLRNAEEFMVANLGKLTNEMNNDCIRKRSRKLLVCYAGQVLSECLDMTAPPGVKQFWKIVSGEMIKLVKKVVRRKQTNGKIITGTPI